MALALKRSNREVVIVERDPEPPEIAPDAAFESWSRPGVPQLRHAHILLARVQKLIRDQHPELFAELRQAGLELSSVTDVLPTPHVTGFQPRPGDEDLVHFYGRRPTFEYVLRKHVGRLANVRFLHSARASGFLTESNGSTLRVRGIELAPGSGRDAIEADIVIDASGKRTKSPEWLEAAGVRVAIDHRPSGFVYACRHYRFTRPLAPASRHVEGNLDFLGYATFWAEHGNYALTLGCPVEDEDLADAMRRPEGFEALCDQLSPLRPWRSQSEATSKVLGAGLFENRWIDYGLRGGRELLGFFAVGDSYIETNPMYGRGCSTAFVQAHVLADALDRTDDPRERLRLYHERTRALLYHYFDFSATTDRLYRIRARLSQGERVPLRDRIFSYLYEVAFQRASHESLLVAREFVKAREMLEVSSPKLRLQMALHLLRALLKSWFSWASAPLRALAPTRGELLRNVPPRAESYPPLPPPG